MKSTLSQFPFFSGIVVTMLLFIVLCAFVTMASAGNDLMQVSSITAEDVGGGGSSTTVDDLITVTSPDVLVNVAVHLSSAHTHICMVTASADVERTVDTTGVYIFGLSMDATGATQSGSDRHVEFVSTPDADLIFQNVSTTFAFSGLTGTHTFYFSARKDTAGTPDTTVTASSMTVVCLRKVL